MSEGREVCVMQSAETVLDVLRERGRRGLPLDELYRQLFNPQLYLLAYGRIYSNKGAMMPGPDAETADGMTMGKIERIIDALRHERYRFKPVRRRYIPKKDGKQRPLGLPSWSDKLVGEVVRLLLEAYYEPQFSDTPTVTGPAGAATPHYATWQSHGPGRPGSSRVTSHGAWWHRHIASAFMVVGSKSPSSAGFLILRPFRRPFRTWTASSSPRLTRCNTVWRETPRLRIASMIGT